MWFTDPVSKNAAAVVTGAGSGIGRAFALELAARGGRVVCSDVNETAARATAKKIGKKQAIALATDVTSIKAVTAMADRARDWFGDEPDLVINNAGVAAGDRIGQMSLEDWRWVIDVNLWGVIHGCHVFAPRLQAAGRGAILNVASAAAFGAAPAMGAYNVSKAGVLSLSETLAAELSGTGVRVGVLMPTFVQTNIAKNSRTPASMREVADKLMERTGVSAEFAARYALDALDRDEIHILPQRDARVMWRFKRLFPTTNTRIAGRIRRVADKYLDF
ncbi:MAG: SDR family NAD(P)-dependent oxidoreductase [Gammaproteobacteria bacterium]